MPLAYPVWEPPAPCYEPQAVRRGPTGQEEGEGEGEYCAPGLGASLQELFRDDSEDSGVCPHPAGAMVCRGTPPGEEGEAGPGRRGRGVRSLSWGDAIAQRGGVH